MSETSKKGEWSDISLLKLCSYECLVVINLSSIEENAQISYWKGAPANNMRITKTDIWFPVSTVWNLRSFLSLWPMNKNFAYV